MKTANELNKEDLRMLLITGHPVACLGAIIAYKVDNLKNRRASKKSKNVEAKLNNPL